MRANAIFRAPTIRKYYLIACLLTGLSNVVAYPCRHLCRDFTMHPMTDRHLTLDAVSRRPEFRQPEFRRRLMAEPEAAHHQRRGGKARGQPERRAGGVDGAAIRE